MSDIMNTEVYTYGDPNADTLLFQMVDEHDLEVIEKEAAYIRELSGGQNFCLKAIKVNSWNLDLSPWPAPAVFGNEDFGDGAAETLKRVLREVDLMIRESASVDREPASVDRESASVEQEVVSVEPEESFVDRETASETQAAVRNSGDSGAEHAVQSKRIFLGGYSLAALFALWAGYQTDRFSGIAAASPSIWFPHFTEYMRENRIHADAVYLSLGDREERTRNPVMSQVGNAIREAEAILSETGTLCTLEWNKGNHFKDSDLRTAKAFAWLMNSCR